MSHGYPRRLSKFSGEVGSIHIFVPTPFGQVASKGNRFLNFSIVHADEDRGIDSTVADGSKVFRTKPSLSIRPGKSRQMSVAFYLGDAVLKPVTPKVVVDVWTSLHA